MQILTVAGIAGAGAAALLVQAEPAVAQASGMRMGPGPRTGQPMSNMPRGANGQVRPMPGPGQVVRPPMRWGGNVDGRWQGGAYAPGGWTAYHVPVRGWVLPSYWITPSFFIDDYATYNLSAPPLGYRWSRYYDDAVLVDERGHVRDMVRGLDWGRYDDGYAYRDDGYDGGYDVADQGVWSNGGYVARDEHRDGDHDRGVAGAAVGGVVGGVAGNVIAGRGNRVAGTVIGAGVGAVAGAAIARSQDRRGPPPPPPAPPPPVGRGYGAAYGTPGHAGPAPAGPRVVWAPHREVVAPYRSERRRVVSEREAVEDHARPYGDGQPYTTVVRGPGTVTTITVVPAVTTTTVTTDYVYERPVRRTGGRPWQARPCACGSKTLYR